MKKTKALIPIVILLALLFSPLVLDNGKGISILPVSVAAAENDVIQNDKTGIPDKVLYQYILKALKKNMDETFTEAEAATIRELRVNWANSIEGTQKDVKSLKGIEYLTNLKSFRISTDEITSMKGIEKLPKLAHLTVDAKNLTDLKGIEDATTLVNLYIQNSKLTSLNGIEKLTKLKKLSASANRLTSLNGIEKLTKLVELYVVKNKLTNLKGVERLTKLDILCVSDNKLTNLKEVEGLYNLTDLEAYNNKLTSLGDFSKLKKLRGLSVQNNKLTSLKGIENATGLTTLVASNNRISSLPDMKKLNRLQFDGIYLKGNKIKKAAFETNMPTKLQNKGVDFQKWVKNQMKFQDINRILEIKKPKNITSKTKTITGKTHAKAYVRISGPGKKKIAEVRADASGNFSFKNLDLKEYKGQKIEIRSFVRDNYDTSIWCADVVKIITIQIPK